MKVLAPLALLLSVSLGACAPTPSRDLVEVSGTGQVKALAEVFRLRASVSARGQDVAALKQQVDQAVAEAVEALGALGLGQEDIRALNLQVHPEWQWEPERRLLGYDASRDLEVRIEGLAAYTAVLERLTRLGIGEIQPAGAEVADPDPLLRQALALALDDARTKAESLARQARRELGPVLSIVETGGQGPAPMAAELAGSGRGGAYSPGPGRITASVRVRFELL